MTKYYFYFKEEITKEEYEKMKKTCELIEQFQNETEACCIWDEILKSYRVIASSENQDYINSIIEGKKYEVKKGLIK